MISVAPLRRAETGGPIVWPTSRSSPLGHPARSSDPDGLWILPEPWKNAWKAREHSPRRLGVSHRSLDGLRPPTGATGSTTTLTQTRKPAKMLTQANAEMEGGCRTSVAALR